MPAIPNINYADYLSGVRSPMDTALQGVQAIKGLEELRNLKAQREAVQAQKEQFALMQKDLFDLAQKEKASVRDYTSIMTKYPSIAEHLKASLDTVSEDERQNLQKQALNVFSAISTGQTDIAKDLLQEQILASENSGDAQSKNAAEAMLKTLEVNPVAAKTSAGLFLASTLGEKEFSTILQKTMGFKTGTTNETDIDDYVRDAQLAWQDEFGTEMPARERNKARLEFKRAQAQEVKANRLAEKEVDSATAEKIAYNQKLGTRLAEMSTAKDLIHAQGKLTEQEAATVAKHRMESNLSKLAKHYLDLDSQGGVVNIENPTMENVWARTKSSSVGQAFQNVLGTTEQSVRNSIKKIKPLLIQDVRQSTNMSARGLDSEKELEFYLQAATDEKSDLQSNIAAIAVLSEAYGDGELAKLLQQSTQPNLINKIKARGQEILNKRKDIVEQPKKEAPSYIKETTEKVKKEVPSYLKELGLE